ncbi:hypothetical protein AB0D13_19520 [Streptomyces sp. NPDC048430]|uniref:hypothetical protein n=1 Tax=Streptomyces sp. NPDC048430 TaxID=3155388 RepID=UPI0034245CD3
MSPIGSHVSGVLPGIPLTSLGCGPSLPALTVAAVAGVIEERAGRGSTILRFVQQTDGVLSAWRYWSVLTARRSDTSANSAGPLHAAMAVVPSALVVAAAQAGRRSSASLSRVGPRVSSFSGVQCSSSTSRCKGPRAHGR